MKKGALCASVLACLLLLLTVLPAGSRAAQNTDAYFVIDEFSDGAVKGEDSASYDYLWVRAALEVNVSGFYNLFAEMTYNQKLIANSANTSYFAPGLHFITLTFSNREIYTSRAVGNYQVNLTLRTPGFPVQSPAEGSYQTAVYHYMDFNPDYTAYYPPGSEYNYVDGANLTVTNSNMTFVFDKSHATMDYYFTRDERSGGNGRFQVAFLRVLGWQVGPLPYFDPENNTQYSASFADASWKMVLLENGTHHLYGPFMKFNITYTMDLMDMRLDQAASSLEVTFSFYFSGNAHPSRDRLTMIPGLTQGELDVGFKLSNTISGIGLVLEQTLRDMASDHDFILRDTLGDLRYTAQSRTPLRPLNPREPDSIPKISFRNRWDGLSYGTYSWETPAVSGYINSSRSISMDVSYKVEGRYLRLFLAYHTQGPYLTIDGAGYFGLDGTTPPGPPPPPPEPEKHDPWLYVLGSGLALSIIFLTMRLRTRSYVKEEEELERIEALELSEAEAGPDAQPLSIEEKAIGEEEEWRRRFNAKKEAPEEGAKGPGGNERGEDGPPGRDEDAEAPASGRPNEAGPPAPAPSSQEDAEATPGGDAGNAGKKARKGPRGGPKEVKP